LEAEIRTAVWGQPEQKVSATSISTNKSVPIVSAILETISRRVQAGKNVRP
jgi:hypothetical protein